MSQAPNCAHLHTMKVTNSKEKKCQECILLGDTWEHLRLCTFCGYVGCCDSSKNKHTTKHCLGLGHPIIKSQERGERWKWCYEDKISWV